MVNNFENQCNKNNKNLTWNYICMIIKLLFYCEDQAKKYKKQGDLHIIQTP